MDFSYKTSPGSIEIGFKDAQEGEIINILKEVLPDPQPQIDAITATVKGFTGRLSISQTGLQTAITNEKEN